MTPDRVKERKIGLARWVREGLIKLGPTFIKIGQQFSTRVDVLSPEFVKELESLQVPYPQAILTSCKPGSCCYRDQPVSTLQHLVFCLCVHSCQRRSVQVPLLPSVWLLACHNKQCCTCCLLCGHEKLEFGKGDWSLS